jgi:sugar diacid utilization regulator
VHPPEDENLVGFLVELSEHWCRPDNLLDHALAGAARLLDAQCCWVAPLRRPISLGLDKPEPSAPALLRLIDPTSVIQSTGAVDVDELTAGQVACAPLRNGRHIVAALLARPRSQRSFSPQQHATLRVISRHLGFTLESAARFEGLSRDVLHLSQTASYIGQLTAAALRHQSVAALAACLTQLLGRDVRVEPGTSAADEDAASSRGSGEVPGTAEVTWPIRRGDRVIAAIRYPREPPLGPSGRDALEHAAILAVPLMLSEQQAQDADWSTRSTVLDELIRVDVPSPALRRRCRILGIEPGPPTQLLVLARRGRPDHGPDHLLAQARVCAAEIAGTSLAETLAVDVAGDVVVLGRRDTDRPAGRVANTLVEKLAAQGINVCIGVSRTDHSIRLAYLEALVCARIAAARRVGLRDVIHPDDLGPLGSLLTSATVEEAVERVREGFAPLLTTERLTRVPLLDMALTYADAGGNRTDMCAALYVHRSTLAYRLRLLQEATGWDLDSAEKRVELYALTTTLRILEARGLDPLGRVAVTSRETPEE